MEAAGPGAANQGSRRERRDSKGAGPPLVNDGDLVLNIQARRKEETSEKRHSHELIFQYAVILPIFVRGSIIR